MVNFEMSDESVSASAPESEKAVAVESGDGGFASAPAPEPEASSEYTLEEALELSARKIEAAEANPAAGSGGPIFDSGDLAITLIVLAVIFGGLAAFFFLKSLRHSKQKPLAKF